MTSTLDFGVNVPVIPLTLETMQQLGQPIKGRGGNYKIDPTSRESDGYVIEVWYKKLYWHPQLDHLVEVWETGTLSFIDIMVELVDGNLKFTGSYLHMTPFEKVVCLPPVVLTHQPVDAIMRLVQILMKQGLACKNIICKRPLVFNSRNAVLLRPLDINHDLVVVCGQCYEKKLLKNPQLAEMVVVDTRRLPPNSPVFVL